MLRLTPAFRNHEGDVFRSQVDLDRERLSAASNLWTYVAVVRDAEGDPGNVRQQWCETHRGQIVRLAKWGAEEALRSYAEYASVMDRLFPSGSGTLRGEPRIAAFQAAVRRRWTELKAAESRRAEMQRR